MHPEHQPTEFQCDVIALIPALRAYAWTLTRRGQDVDDLVQETLAKAIANVDKFRMGTNLRAWLMTIMRNTFLNEIVKTSRLRTGGTECVSARAWVPATQEWSLRGREIRMAIAALPASYRETLVLVVMLGVSYEETARICGVSIGTVKSRVNRGKALLLDRLGEGAAAGV